MLLKYEHHSHETQATMTENEQADQSAIKPTEETVQLAEMHANDNVDYTKDHLRRVLESRQSETLSAQELTDLAKSREDAALLIKELIDLNRVDETELADQVAKVIVSDIEEYVDSHLEKYRKYTLNAPQMSLNVHGSSAKFFNLISLLKDVSILGRKLLEASSRFDLFKPKTPATPNLISNLNPIEKKWLMGPGPSCASSQRDSRSQMSEDDATSDDLLAASIESSSSDDFLVLSSSLDSITNRDMMVAVLMLITSHECFTLSHDIQGVVLVLRRAKFMIKNILAPRNQMELVTKLLTSIKRYNEMNYVFDLFRDRNQFETLLSKGVEKTPELRIALFNYVKKNPEFYALVTLNFSMYREIAESLEASATRRLDKLILAKRDKQKVMKKRLSLITSGSGAGGLGSFTAATAAAAAPSAHEKYHQKQLRVDQDGQIDHSSGYSASATVQNEVMSSAASSASNSMTKSLPIGTNLGHLGGLSGSRLSSSGAGAKGDCGNNNKLLYSRDSLNICLVEMVDASDCYAKAGCYKRANDSESKAKLIALQLALLAQTTTAYAIGQPAQCTSVLDLQPSELNDSIVSFESFFDAYIVAEAYNYHLAWRQALFRNVLLRGQLVYLVDYCSKCDLSTGLVMELVLLYRQYDSRDSSQEEIARLAAAMKSILARVEDVELRCKLYTRLQFDDAKQELLQNPSVRAYLMDLKLA